MMSENNVKKNRKERRIDYTKKDIADYIFCSESSVDNKIAEFYRNYGIDELLFKRSDSEKWNFFPPEYTPLLLLLLSKDKENPLTMSEKGRKKVTAESIRNYNRDMLSAITEKGSELLPEELKNFIEQMPWFRVSCNIGAWIDVLVEEFQQLLYNLLTLPGTDIGETIKYVSRELDKMNYCLFRGSYLRNNVHFQSQELEQENQKVLYEEFAKKIAEGNKKKWETPDLEKDFQEEPYFRYFYNAYREKKEIRKVDKSDISIDQGIVAVMRAIMDGIGLEYLQKYKIDSLPQYYSDEKRENVEKEMLPTDKKMDEQLLHKVDETERLQYMKERVPEICKYLNSFCKTYGTMNFSNISDSEWKSIPERIKEGSFQEDYKEEYISGAIYARTGLSYEDWMNVVMKPSKEIFGEMCRDYVEHYSRVKKEKTQLYDIVNIFVGQVIANYYTKR